MPTYLGVWKDYLPCRCNTRISNAPSAPTIRFPFTFLREREPTYPVGQISVGDRVRITSALTLAYASQTGNRVCSKPARCWAQDWLAEPLPSAPAKYRWAADWPWMTYLVMIS